MTNSRQNRLADARRRLGLEQKQVANLIGLKNISTISRYEIGDRNPPLEQALKLSILYKLPLRVLFYTAYQRSRDELSMRASKNRTRDFMVDLTEPIDYCAYIEIMKTGLVNDIDQEKIRRHILELFDDRRVMVLDH